MAEASPTTAPTPAERIAEAVSMVETFESVGVRRFDATLTDQHRIPIAFKAARSSTGLRGAIAAGYLAQCEERQRNIIIRPILANGPCRLVQLDDLPRGKVDEIDRYSLLTLETSPGNFQVWLAVEGLDEDQARELKRTTGADLYASGAARLAGSLNFKADYAPNFPAVRLRTAAPGRTTTADELRAIELLPEALTPVEVERRPRAPDRAGPRSWPSYD